MATVRRTGRSRAENDKSGKAKRAGGGEDLALLTSETVRLREELASERQRSEGLESVNAKVAARLDAAIASIKTLLQRQD